MQNIKFGHISSMDTSFSVRPRNTSSAAMKTGHGHQQTLYPEANSISDKRTQ